MNKIFFSVGMSLDGFIAGLYGGPENPLGDRGTSIHTWIYNQKMFRENLGMGEGGETGRDNDLLNEITARAGVSIMGKRMFEEGAANWPENAPFHTPVYVLTHEKRDPWERKGGTTFYFVNDGMQNALRQATMAAGAKDIRIAGGADTIQQFLNAGLIDDFTIHLAPVFLGSGVRLFQKLDTKKLKLEQIDSFSSQLVTHITYKVIP